MDKTAQPDVQENAAPPENHFNLKPFSINKPSNRTTVIIIVVVIFVLSGMLTYILVAPSKKTIVSPATREIPLAPASPTAVPTATPVKPSPTLTLTLTPTPTLPQTVWNTYSNSTYGYSIKYPPDWIARDLGVLEPKVPSNIAFNPTTASSSSRFITITISNRTYQEQLALGSASSSTTIGGITGTRQFFQDSNGQISTAIILPRTSNLLILRSKTPYLTIFNQMITTLQANK